MNVTLPVDSFPECDAMDTNKIGDGICDGKNDGKNDFNSSILPAPSEYKDVIWNAKGNVRSCEAQQGFFIFLGSMAAPLYNCSLCFYQLAILKFNKNQRKNRTISSWNSDSDFSDGRVHDPGAQGIQSKHDSLFY